MTIPYYFQTENRNRCINFGNIEDNNTLLSPIVGSYLTSSGFLVDCTGGHKGNDFYYSIYYNGVIDLLCSDEEKKSLISYNTLESHNKQLKILKMYLSQLKKGNLSNFHVLFKKYYNLAREFSYLNFDEIKNNLIGLIEADIEIYECFKELKIVGESLVDITGYKNKDVFGVIVGQEPIIEVADTYLSLTLKNKNDFLVQVVGFDKIETQLNKVITTSKLNINETFFNYLLMEWKIYQLPRYVIDQDNKKLKEINNFDYSIANNSGLEREMDKEIQLVKKLIPISKRPNYFI